MSEKETLHSNPKPTVARAESPGIDASKTPIVTVAIATCCDRSRLLAEAIRGVISQTLEDIEIFVSNDGSTDDTPAVVASFEDPRLQLLELPQPGGLHANLNSCLRLGTAPYVAICQDDDIWLPRNLERLMATMEAHPKVVLAHGAFRWIDEHGNLLKEWSAWGAPKHDTVASGDEFIMWSMRGINKVNMSSALMRRSAVQHEAFKKEDDVLCDTGMWMRLARHGDVAFVAEPLSSLRIHARTISVRSGTNEPELRGRTLREIELAQKAKERFLLEAGYVGDELRTHQAASRSWVRSELLRLVTRNTSPARSTAATLRLLYRAIRIEPSLAIFPRTWRVAFASAVGSKGRGLFRRLQRSFHDIDSSGN